MTFLRSPREAQLLLYSALLWDLNIFFISYNADEEEMICWRGFSDALSAHCCHVMKRFILVNGLITVIQFKLQYCCSTIFFFYFLTSYLQIFIFNILIKTLTILSYTSERKNILTLSFWYFLHRLRKWFKYFYVLLIIFINC